MHTSLQSTVSTTTTTQIKLLQLAAVQSLGQGEVNYVYAQMQSKLMDGVYLSLLFILNECSNLIQDVVVETGLCKDGHTTVSDVPLSPTSSI